MRNIDVPFFDDLRIGNLRGTHELGEKVAKDTDEDPISDHFVKKKKNSIRMLGAKEDPIS